MPTWNLPTRCQSLQLTVRRLGDEPAELPASSGCGATIIAMMGRIVSRQREVVNRWSVGQLEGLALHLLGSPSRGLPERGGSSAAANTMDDTAVKLDNPQPAPCSGVSVRKPDQEKTGMLFEVPRWMDLASRSTHPCTSSRPGSAPRCELAQARWRL